MNLTISNVGGGFVIIFYKLGVVIPLLIVDTNGIRLLWLKHARKLIRDE
jgi:hypothetical protein